jgi:hypothetical protein
MSEEKDHLSRREALKGIAAGLGAAGSLPVLNQNVLGQQGHSHEGHGQAPKRVAAKKPEPPKFFSARELALVTTISELIIPTDDHSPGAKAAEVPAFIDLMVSESPEETKALWRDGLAAVDKASREKFAQDFTGATAAQQTALLTEISKNERSPKTLEERFFRAIKNLTIDGYYTSEIGIKQELQYKGNTYLKEFKGCTHPEHQT